MNDEILNDQVSRLKEDALTGRMDRVREDALAGKADCVKSSVLADKAKAAAIHEAQRKSREVLDGHRLTRMEAETTPEALKVKRARAQAAYNENRNDMAPKQLYDIKVK